MIRFTTLILLPGLFTLLPADITADDTEDRESLFDALDQNQDGVLQSNEINDGQRRAFERLIRVGDADDDGQLTKAEYLAASGPEAPVSPEQMGRRQQAQRGGQGRLDVDQLFARADQDGDGKISLDDLPEPAQQRLLPLFERIGKDEVTREDFARLRPMPGRRPSGQQARQQRQMTLLRVLDEDGNGLLSSSEISRISERFSELDRNGDGQLGPGELIGFPAGEMERARMRQRSEDDSRPERPRRPGESPEGNRPRRESDRSRPERLGAAAIIRQFDADEDGTLSREEAPDRLSGRFDRIDTSGDGKLSSDELQRAFEAARRGRERN